MSKINPKKAYASEIFDGFNGIGADQTPRGRGMLSMRNFRILPDGSIQKRCGWRTLASLLSPMRGCWFGELNNQSLGFAVANSSIYRLNEIQKTKIGELSTYDGTVRFFTYGGILYLLDGDGILRYDANDDRFVTASGYVPLFGVDWHPLTLGAMNEPLNLLNDRVRLHYKNQIGATNFLLPFYVSSIDQVRLDGKVTNDFTISEEGNSFSVTKAATSVEVACTIQLYSETKQTLISSPCAFAYNDGIREQLLIYGSRSANLLFCATDVNENMIGASKAIYPDSDPLYFNSRGTLPLGDSAHPITSVCRHHDRFLAFHKDGAYSLSVTEGGTAEAYPLLGGMGCRATDAILQLDGDPVVINSGGVFALHTPLSDRDDFTYEALSEALPELRSDSFTDLALTVADPAHGELWFAAPSSDIYVFNTTRRQWYVFRNVDPFFFFRYGDRVGFASNDVLGVFEDGLTADNGSPIVANIQTGYLSFGNPEVLKRTLRLSVCADAGCRATVDVSSEKKSLRFVLDGSSQRSFPVVFDQRLSIGRFRMLRLTINDSLGINSRYYRLALFANV